MKKARRLYIAHKKTILLCTLFTFNVCIFIATQMQRNHYYGHVKTPDNSKTVTLNQFGKELNILVTYYDVDDVKFNYDSQQFRYLFKKTGTNRYILRNNEMSVKVVIHRIFDLDGQCNLLFRTPYAINLANVSMLCKDPET
ncbi:hypothetical protein GCE9029_00932 [Grimontia celer]|uniref:Uncharacterized protein n=1 Tax=Grimontia celer TaxID=1796497 RepID=A0A128EWR1_9GAMM|nr:hypothetical protein GCE9029_00932 [Grimontia celer]